MRSRRGGRPLAPGRRRAFPNPAGSGCGHQKSSWARTSPRTSVGAAGRWERVGLSGSSQQNDTRAFHRRPLPFDTVLSRPFIALFVCVFVATMGISMVSPLLPVYARDLGASGIWLGLGFAAFAPVQAIVGPFVGRWSDRVGRKPFIICGLLVYLVAAIGYLTAESFYQVIAFRAFSGLGTSMIFSVSQAYLGDMTPAGHEGRWFGVYATADIVGFATGPLLAGVMRDVIGFDSVFIAMAGMLAASTAIVFFWLPAKPPAPPERRHRTEPVVNVPFLRAIRHRLVWALLLQNFLVSVGSGAAFAFLSLRLEEDLGLRAWMIGLAFTVQDLSAGIGQPFFGWLADTRSRRLLVVAGMLCYAAIQMGLALAGTYAAVVVLLLGLGAASGLSGVASSAMRIVAGRRIGMGTMLGMNSMANGAGILFGALAGGLIVDLHGIPASFVFAGSVIGIGTLVFAFATRGVETREAPLPVDPRPDLATATGA
ncbi:MAG: MFS transporter [Dehalococcoidia bacterium]